MMVVEIQVHKTLDVRGFARAQALIEIARNVMSVEPGAVVTAWSTGEELHEAIPAWVELAGHRLVGVEARDGYDEFFIERSG